MSVVRQAAKAVFAAADLVLPSPTGPRMLIYHQVGAGLGRQMEVTREAFEWQLDWLAENREVVHLADAIRRWEEPGSDKMVVITFDDGYRDTIETAFPLLSQRSFPFTLYLATMAIEKGKGGPGARPLSWDQIRDMMSSGLVTIGSHTDTHLDLSHAPRARVEDELARSDAIIQERLQTVSEHFAYPWGYWSATADGIVRRRYQTAALGAHADPSIPFDPHKLHRFPVQLSDGTRWFESRLEGGLLLEERTRRRLRGYRGA